MTCLRYLRRIHEVMLWVVACMLITAFSANSLWASEHTYKQPSFVPELVHQALPEATLTGQGQLRFFGLHIYDASLWVTPHFDAKNYDMHPMVLELTYYRSFRGADIAQRSIDEIQRQRSLTAAQTEQWLEQLTSLLPDVQAGDRLTGLYQPKQGMLLWHNAIPLEASQEPELASLFFGIWLSPATSEPNLRRKLLALSPGVIP